MIDPNDIKRKLSWEIDPLDPMVIDIWYRHDRIDGDPVKMFSIFLGEAMECAGRELVLAHVKACDSQSWVTNWHENTLAKKAKAWKILSE